jgi:transcriptional regulator with XRE-family HTH domain
MPATPPDDPVFTLGDHMAKARKRAGISVQEMADLLLRGRNTITHYESDKTRPTARILKRWAELCGVSVEWLTGTRTALDSPSRRSRPSGGAQRDHRPAKKAATKPTAGPATHQYAGRGSRSCIRRHAQRPVSVR